MNEVVAKGAFLSKVRPPFMPQYQGSSTKANIHHCFYCVSKRMKKAHDKSRIAESLHAQITKARLTACEVGVFSKLRPPPSFRSHLSWSLKGVFSRDHGKSVLCIQLSGDNIWTTLQNMDTQCKINKWQLGYTYRHEITNGQQQGHCLSSALLPFFISASSSFTSAR